jgi:hypothetical protein
MASRFWKTGVVARSGQPPFALYLDVSFFLVLSRKQDLEREGHCYKELPEELKRVSAHEEIAIVFGSEGSDVLFGECIHCCHRSLRMIKIFPVLFTGRKRCDKRLTPCARGDDTATQPLSIISTVSTKPNE